MKRRLTIARSLVNDPELLLLDEPTTGLDPQARHVVWDRLFRLKQRGVTLVLTTHYMDEAEQLCDRLVVMDHGRIVAEGSPRQLIEKYSTREVVEVRFEDDRRAERRLAGAGDRVEELPGPHLVYTDDGDATATAIAERGLAAALDARPAQHARGRLPAPDRPDAGRLTMDGILQPLRAYEHWLAQYKRVWRGTIGTSLVNPLLYLAALGVGLGTIVDSSANAPAGVPYLDFIAPGLLAAAAMQTAATESSWPVMGAIKWTRTYYAMTATPLTERDVLIGHQLFVITRVLTASAAYLLVVAAFGAVNSWLGLLAIPSRS